MREYAKKPESQSRTIDTNPKTSRQAPIDVILQRYKERSIQRYVSGEEEEPLQEKCDTVQRERKDEDELLLDKFELTPNTGRKHIQHEENPNNTGLPDNLKTGIENLSGYSMSDVRVHYNSNKPAQLQTLAYTQGTDIYVAPRQEQHLPHEAWHVVQQKQGVNVNDNEGLEKEADVIGGRALENASSPNREIPVLKEAASPTLLPVQRFPQEIKDPLYQESTFQQMHLRKIKAETELLKYDKFIIKGSEQIVYWDKTSEKYKTKKPRAQKEDEKIYEDFDLEAYKKNPEFLDFTTIYKEVSVAIGKEMDPKKKAALAMHLLQKFISNAVYTSEEVEKMHYQASPLNYQDSGGYIRSQATAFVEALKSFLEKGDIKNEKLLFLTQHMDFNEIAKQYLTEINPDGDDKVKLSDATSNEIADYYLDKQNLKGFEHILFWDVTEKLKEGDSKDAQKTIDAASEEIKGRVLTSVIDVFIKKYVNKHYDDAEGKEAIQDELIKHFKDKKPNIVKFIEYINAKEKKTFEDKKQNKLESLVEINLTEDKSTEYQIFERYKKHMNDFKIWLSEKCKIKGTRPDLEKLKVKDQNDFKKLLKENTVIFNEFIRDEVVETQKKTYTDITAETIIQNAEYKKIQNQLADLGKQLSAITMVGGSVELVEKEVKQSSFLLSSNTSDALLKQVKFILNKSGYVPTPTAAGRKMLEMGKPLQDIISSVSEKQKVNIKSGYVQEKIEQIRTVVTGFNPLSYTSVYATADKLLQSAKQVHDAFITWSQDKAEWIKTQTSSVTKLIASIKILDDTSPLPAIALAELKINLKDAMRNEDDIAAFIRNIQNIHEILILALESGTAPPTKFHDSLLPPGAISPHYTDYGLKAFSQAFNAVMAQHAGSGVGSLIVDTYADIYFELLDKFRSASSIGSDKRIIMRDPFAQATDTTEPPHLIMIDIHPNDASKEEVNKQEILNIIKKIFEKKPDHVMTVVVDITLNHIGEKEISDLKTSVQEYIDNGSLNLVFVQSLTKFAQLGMDKHSGGFMFHYNKGDKWKEFNQSITKATSEHKVDPTVEGYFNSLYSVAPDEQKAYLKLVRDNKKYVYDTLKAAFAAISDPKAICLSGNEDIDSCYVAFNYEVLSAFLFAGTKDQRGISTEQLGKDILALIYSIVSVLQLPLSMRQSFGFPISNFGEAWVGSRFTIGTEPHELLDQYMEIIIYVNKSLSKGLISIISDQERSKRENRKNAFYEEIKKVADVAKSLMTELAGNPLLKTAANLKEYFSKKVTEQ